jgi:hypothetical protein
LSASHADGIGTQQHDLSQCEMIIGHENGFRTTTHMASNRLSGNPALAGGD